MQFDSINAKHKLFIAAMLLLLFAIPFAWQARSLSALNSKAVLAGGSVIGNKATGSSPVVPTTNYAAQATVASGSTFTGALAQ